MKYSTYIVLLYRSMFIVFLTYDALLIPQFLFIFFFPPPSLLPEYTLHTDQNG